MFVMQQYCRNLVKKLSIDTKIRKVGNKQKAASFRFNIELYIDRALLSSVYGVTSHKPGYSY